jgi:hypothetical protein
MNPREWTDRPARQRPPSDGACPGGQVLIDSVTGAWRAEPPGRNQPEYEPAGRARRLGVVREDALAECLAP